MGHRWTLIPLAVACAVSLAAQQPPAKDPHAGIMMRGMPMQGGMMDPGMDQMMQAMMGRMVYAPAHLLMMQDSLKLTPAQVTALTSLRDRSKAAHDAALAAAKPHLDAMAQASDSAAVKEHFTAAHDAMGKAHWAELSAALQAQALLSAPQRATVQAMVDSMRARMRAQHPDMMDRHNRP